MSIIDVNDSNFDAEVLQSDIPVIVDFWAEWCGPCKMLAPIFHEVAGDNEGKMKFAKVNVDQAQEIPAKYGVRGIPTLLVIKGGEVVETKVGSLSKPQLQDLVDANA